MMSVENVGQGQESEGTGGYSRYRWNVLMNVQVVVAIFLIAVVPVYAQAQSPSVPRVSKDDAHKVATIISGDKTKTQTYCDILKLSQQIEQAYGRRDIKMVDELTQKIATLEKTLGPELLALVVGLQDIDPNDKLGAEIVLELETINRLCTR